MAQLEALQPQAAKKLALRVAVVVEHPAVPAVVQCLPIGLQAQQGAAAHHAPHGATQQAGGRLQALQKIGTCRCDRGGGVDAHPALVGQPHLRPGMGIALAHRPEAIDRVALATLVAGDDARRDIGCAHQHGKG